MKTILHHKGWRLVAFQQIKMEPFLDFVCIASREVSTRKFTGIEMFNREGHSIEEAITAAVKEIDR